MRVNRLLALALVLIVTGCHPFEDASEQTLVRDTSSDADLDVDAPPLPDAQADTANPADDTTASPDVDPDDADVDPPPSCEEALEALVALADAEGGRAIPCAPQSVCCEEGACCPPRMTCGASGVCVCDDPFADCNTQLTDGCETDLSQSLADCGECDLSCGPEALPSGVAVCEQGACGVVCEDDWGDCDGRASTGCETLLLDNLLHCGACYNACDPGELCREGACTCALDGVCADCETTCEADEVCADAPGADSECVCPSGFERCSGDCVDPMTDPDHCGACGLDCAPGAICHQGVCRCKAEDGALEDNAACPDGDERACCQGVCSQEGSALCACEACSSDGDHVCCPGGHCALLGSDPEHCGACGAACDDGEGCFDGTCWCGDEVCDDDTTCMIDPATGQARCSCPPGSQRCGELCVDLREDDRHCGACDRVCPDSYDHAEALGCVNSQCAFACEGDWRDCDGLAETGCDSLIVSDSVPGDDAFCGACGVVCGDLEVCSGGACVCAEGLTRCGANGRCVDTLSNLNHCGACDAPCDANQVCNAGQCACATAVNLCGAGGRNCCGACVLNICLGTTTNTP